MIAPDKSQSLLAKDGLVNAIVISLLKCVLRYILPSIPQNKEAIFSEIEKSIRMIKISHKHLNGQVSSAGPKENITSIMKVARNPNI